MVWLRRAVVAVVAVVLLLVAGELVVWLRRAVVAVVLLLVAGELVVIAIAGVNALGSTR